MDIDETHRTISLKLLDGTTIQMESSLGYLSNTVQELLTFTKEDNVEIPIQLEEITPESVKLLNECIKFLRDSNDEKLREHVNEREYWVENTVSSCLLLRLRPG